MKRQIVAAFLILDFSGSMDQLVQQRPKHEVLKNTISSMFQSSSDRTLYNMVVFGTQPHKKCADFQERKLKYPEAERWLQDLKPGTYGMTPLAESFRRLGTRASELRGENIVAVTDGADTCGEDPCRQLKKLNEQLKVVQARINLNIIGFDLQENKELSCFQELKGKLSNIDLDFYLAGTGASLSKALMKSQAKQSIPQDNGAVVVTGAPEEAVFYAKCSGQKKSKSWVGEFTVHLVPGFCFLSLEKLGEQTVPVQIRERDVIKVPYSSFFKFKTGTLRMNPQFLELEFHPDEETAKIHPEAKVKQLTEEQSVNLEFGRWVVTVKSPWWLENAVSAVVEIKAHQEIRLTSEELFKENLSWYDVSATEPRALKVGGNKILVMPGVTKIPYLKSLEVQWITK